MQADQNWSPRKLTDTVPEDEHSENARRGRSTSGKASPGYSRRSHPLKGGKHPQAERSERLDHRRRSRSSSSGSLHPGRALPAGAIGAVRGSRQPDIHLRRLHVGCQVLGRPHVGLRGRADGLLEGPYLLRLRISLHRSSWKSQKRQENFSMRSALGECPTQRGRI